MQRERLYRAFIRRTPVLVHAGHHVRDKTWVTESEREVVEEEEEEEEEDQKNNKTTKRDKWRDRGCLSSGPTLLLLGGE